MCQGPMHEFLKALPKCEHHMHLEGESGISLRKMRGGSKSKEIPLFFTLAGTREDKQQPIPFGSLVRKGSLIQVLGYIIYMLMEDIVQALSPQTFCSHLLNVTTSPSPSTAMQPSRLLTSSWPVTANLPRSTISYTTTSSACRCCRPHLTSRP